MLKIKNPITARSSGVLFFLLGGFFLFSAAVFFSYHLVYARKIIPGVKMGNKFSLEGKTKREAAAFLLGRFRRLETSPFILKLEGNEASVSGQKRIALEGGAFDFAYDASASALAAYRLGRSGLLFNDLLFEWKSWLFGSTSPPVYFFDKDKLERAAKEALSAYLRPAKEASFVVKEGSLSISPQEVGIAFDEEELRNNFVKAVERLEKEVIVPLRLSRPTAAAEDLTPLKGQVAAILLNPPRLLFGSSVWQPKKETLLTFLKFEKGRNGVVGMTVDREALGEYLSSLASRIDVPPRGRVIEVEGKRAVKFIPPREGLELDRFEAANLISRALSDARLPREIVLPVKTIRPLPSGSPDYGIKELLGEGVTDFSGSIPARVHNIKLAASRLNGLLVSPGEIFSFNGSLGEVSAKTGYNQAYIIAKGRTVLGTGGGVCQVSTTLFRAALFAGLPIVKRTAHDYRVHYYEPPVGLDATVYAPAIDFQFKNDTPSFILIQTEVAGSRLYFRIYGTPDGRAVEVSEPVVSRETAPPPPLYQADPTLPRGVKKQIDWAAWGASVVVKRQVRRGEERLQSDTFRSYYKAWRAVYLVGTKD